MIGSRQERELQELVEKPLLEISPKPLAGKSAIVTGAVKFNGIGFAIAERFAAEGAAPLILVGTPNNQDIAPFIRKRLEKYGAVVQISIGDVTKPTDCRDIIDRANRICHGHVDILVNNAGTNRDVAFGALTESDWEYVMRAKLAGTVFMTQAWFKSRNEDNIRGGRVINIGSVVGIYGNFGQELYAATNGGVHALTKSLSLDLGRRSITVNVIAPGFVEGTDMTAGLSEDQMRLSRTVSSLEELVQPGDVAAVAAFLAGPGADKITGLILPIDGGIQSNFTGARKLHSAGFRQIPRRLLSKVMEMIRHNEDGYRQ